MDSEILVVRFDSSHASHVVVAAFIFHHPAHRALLTFALGSNNFFSFFSFDTC